MPIDFPNSPSNGQEHTVGSTTWTYDGAKWNIKTVNAVSNDSMPVGAIMWFGGSSTPTAWLLCNGSAVSRSTYANLFAVVGTTYGSGDGSTTFNLPNISSTTGAYYIRFTTSVGVVSTTALATAPVGTMFDWPTTSSYPTGFLRADGSAVSRTTYADLFALCGTTYGVGDNSTTFNLPNLPAAGAGSPVKIIKATSSGVVEPSTVAHSATHGASGSDPVTITLNQVSNYQTSRNAIINGSMSVAQRSTSATPFVSADGYYTADRWKTYTTNSSGSWTQSIQTDAPSGSGFTKSLRMFRTTGAAIGTYEYSHISQAIEGQNLQHFSFGNSSAKNLCISFWVKSNVVGTYTTELTTTSSRRYTATYTINVAGTWEKKTINVPKDTATTIPDSNAEGMRLWFILGAGSFFVGANSNTNTNWWNTSTPQYTSGTQVDVGLTTNNYWQITGVQLEAGDVATPFEFEPYETTLRKCQRYYYKITAGSSDAEIATGYNISTTQGSWYIPFPQEMRIPPTTIETTMSAPDYYVRTAAGVSNCSLEPTWASSTRNGVRVIANRSGLTAGQASMLGLYSSTPGFIAVSAEL